MTNRGKKYAGVVNINCGYSRRREYVFNITVSTQNATPPESTKSRNSNSSVQIQIKPKSQFEFLPRNTEKLLFLDLVDFGGIAILVETVIIHGVVDVY